MVFNQTGPQGLKSTSQLANELGWGWHAKTSPTDWVRNFIYRHDLPYSKWGRFIHLNEEQEDEFWRAIELYRRGFI